ncbi:hypothetical protein QM467_18325 [Rhodoblastus sp. 17X3]|uniref:hypothetical protein n=1 Tax=Rhodoblastus sp. 17X3 TaxID=3047026 RepID=UPI0024B66A27|nr:hypothetical protein [Rhodoblastus sp. 17X3]MDI9849998.1 hypothetical protein [Rhodoblastus sp. 17X3]
MIETPPANASRISSFLRPDEVVRVLDGRLGRVHARQRLGIEDDHEMQAFGLAALRLVDRNSVGKF